jgi:hypothetical protein
VAEKLSQFGLVDVAAVADAEQPDVVVVGAATPDEITHQLVGDRVEPVEDEGVDAPQHVESPQFAQDSPEGCGDDLVFGEVVFCRWYTVVLLAGDVVGGPVAREVYIAEGTGRVEQQVAKGRGCRGERKDVREREVREDPVEYHSIGQEVEQGQRNEGRRWYQRVGQGHPVPVGEQSPARNQPPQALSVIHSVIAGKGNRQSNRNDEGGR